MAIKDSDRHGHVIPSDTKAACGGPTWCDDCFAELKELGLTVKHWNLAQRIGHARLLAALLRVCHRDYSSEGKAAVLKELGLE